jgi:hypothetical protein
LKKKKTIFIPPDLKPNPNPEGEAWLSCRLVEEKANSDLVTIESEIFDGTKFTLEARRKDIVIGGEVDKKIRCWLKIIMTGEQGGRAAITLPYPETRWGSRISVLTKRITLQPPT